MLFNGKKFGDTKVGQTLGTVYRLGDQGLIGSALRFSDILNRYRNSTGVSVTSPTNENISNQGPVTSPTIDNQTQTSESNTQTTPERNTSLIQTTNSLKGTDRENQAKLDGILLQLNSFQEKLNEYKANQTATDNTDTGATDTGTDEETDVDKERKKIEKDAEDEMESAKSLLDKQRAFVRASAQGLIDTITAKFEKRIEQMKETNKMLYRTAEQAGYRSNRARYAPIMNAAILTGEEQAGLQRISDLESEAMQLIIQAETARDKNDLAALEDYLNQIDKIKDQQQEALVNLYDRVQESEQLALDKAKEARLKMKDDLDLSTTLSEKIAPAFADQLSKFTTDEEKLDFAIKLSEKYGINDPAILLGEMANKNLENKKAQADINNVYSLIANRGKDGTTGDELGGGGGEFDGEFSGAGGSDFNTGGTPKEYLEITSSRARRLDKEGISSADLIALQDNLNAGFTLDEILGQSSDISSKAERLLRKYIKKVK